MFATVVNPIAPAVLFLLAAVVLGARLSMITKRVLVSSLIASALVAAVFVLFLRYLSMDFMAYSQDAIYEPLMRDFILLDPIEGTLSALFHFGIPYLIIARWFPPKRSKE